MATLRCTLMAASASLLLAGLAGAHPHIFITTWVEVQFGATGLAEALRIVWA